MVQTAQAVPRAHAGPITDDIILQAIEVSCNAADNDRLSSAGAALILFIARPALEELLEYRRRMRLICAVAGDNVILMPPLRG